MPHKIVKTFLVMSLVLPLTSNNNTFAAEPISTALAMTGLLKTTIESLTPYPDLDGIERSQIRRLLINVNVELLAQRELLIEAINAIKDTPEHLKRTIDISIAEDFMGDIDKIRSRLRDAKRDMDAGVDATPIFGELSSDMDKLQDLAHDLIVKDEPLLALALISGMAIEREIYQVISKSEIEARQLHTELLERMEAYGQRLIRETSMIPGQSTLLSMYLALVDERNSEIKRRQEDMYGFLSKQNEYGYNVDLYVRERGNTSDGRQCEYGVRYYVGDKFENFLEAEGASFLVEDSGLQLENYRLWADKGYALELTSDELHYEEDSAMASAIARDAEIKLLSLALNLIQYELFRTSVLVDGFNVRTVYIDVSGDLPAQFYLLQDESAFQWQYRGIEGLYGHSAIVKLYVFEDGSIYAFDDNLQRGLDLPAVPARESEYHDAIRGIPITWKNSDWFRRDYIVEKLDDVPPPSNDAFIGKGVLELIQRRELLAYARVLRLWDNPEYFSRDATGLYEAHCTILSTYSRLGMLNPWKESGSGGPQCKEIFDHKVFDLFGSDDIFARERSYRSWRSSTILRIGQDNIRIASRKLRQFVNTIPHIDDRELMFGFTPTDTQHDSIHSEEAINYRREMRDSIVAIRAELRSRLPSMGEGVMGMPIIEKDAKDLLFLLWYLLDPPELIQYFGHYNQSAQRLSRLLLYNKLGIEANITDHGNEEVDRCLYVSFISVVRGYSNNGTAFLNKYRD